MPRVLRTTRHRFLIVTLTVRIRHVHIMSPARRGMWSRLVRKTRQTHIANRVKVAKIARVAMKRFQVGIQTPAPRVITAKTAYQNNVRRAVRQKEGHRTSRNALHRAKKLRRLKMRPMLSRPVRSTIVHPVQDIRHVRTMLHVKRITFRALQIRRPNRVAFMIAVNVRQGLGVIQMKKVENLSHAQMVVRPMAAQRQLHSAMFCVVARSRMVR